MSIAGLWTAQTPTYVFDMELRTFHLYHAYPHVVLML